VTRIERAAQSSKGRVLPRTYSEASSRRSAGTERSVAVRRRLRQYLPAIVVFLAVLVGWELVVWAFNIRQFLLPPPSRIVAAFFEIAGDLGTAASRTLSEAIGGFLIGMGLAIIISFITYRSAGAQKALLPLAIAASSIPTIVFAPIMNNWFGSTNPLSKMALVVLFVFFPIVLHLVRGLTLVDPSALELMHSYGATERTILRKLRIPNALPYFFTALKISATLSLIGAIVGEYFGGPLLALGVLIINHALQFRLHFAWAAIIVACFSGIAFYLIIVLVERLVIPWHASIRTHQR
jgi:NitT/TauT family transport system permease protein